MPVGTTIVETVIEVAADDTPPRGRSLRPRRSDRPYFLEPVFCQGPQSEDDELVVIFRVPVGQSARNHHPLSPANILVISYRHRNLEIFTQRIAFEDVRCIGRAEQPHWNLMRFRIPEIQVPLFRQVGPVPEPETDVWLHCWRGHKRLGSWRVGIIEGREV